MSRLALATITHLQAVYLLMYVGHLTPWGPALQLGEEELCVAAQMLRYLDIHIYRDPKHTREGRPVTAIK
ncbi:hypothetical protein NDU88_000431 [Pleurodeles waltl]|uniref:Uncharacterized protein n=1 Tax=Pleurodeles waltl TaxID=8319 RepID=A0AAV7V541_PLEWA|nr:hypothetical protein NDU88_000431 [Pleurodeles waltl]